MSQLDGNADFRGMEIGRDASTLDNGPTNDPGEVAQRAVVRRASLTAAGVLLAGAGPWVNGDGTAPPVLDFSAGGLACPTGATTATFKAGYTVTDTTDPAQQITVSDGTPVPSTDEPTPDPTGTVEG